MVADMVLADVPPVVFGWGGVKLAYRHLAYDQEGDSFIQDLSFSGPALGIGFRF